MNKDSPSKKPPASLTIKQLAIAAIAIAVALRILNLGSREFWYDEVLSLLLSTGQKIAYQTPKDTPVALADYTILLNLPPESGIPNLLKTLTNLLRGLAGGEPHPPLFFLSQHLWLRLFGNSETATRSLGTLLSIGAISSAYGLGRYVLGHRGGLLLAALLATNPFYFFHSLNLRMYGPVVLWATLSAWALLQLIQNNKPNISTEEPKIPTPIPKSPNPGSGTHFPPFLWDILLIGSVAAGCLTFYLFAYWAVALAGVAIYLDRQRWWQHGLRLGAGVALCLPWGLWGIPQQLRNADLQRFAPPAGFFAATLQHLQDLAQTLGIHLLFGDWITSLPQTSAAIAGCAIIVLLATGSASLWRNGERQSLGLALLLGIFPLLLALGADIATGKFTLGFGWGRSMIVILPGCLLLLAVWLEQTPQRWRSTAAVALLLLYLSASIADFSARSRWMFHKIADVVAREPAAPTLIAMNSQAWGHVMRLAYYIPPDVPVSLLAQPSAQLAPALEKALKTGKPAYSQIVWLESAAPVWSPPATDTERQKIEEVLKNQFQLSQQQSLSGTMDLDEFTLKLYKRYSATGNTNNEYEPA
ncbi:glycosyltransferase family 39 protein [Kamptonema formosum]|uniref:glycosyltransferase family 39 protein n=1 Tax=Kamptonema formosum TaxID=331992 RepID=UPI0003465524|nr:glycosyltransferase family 39 protein [Oscillatoria sp. PCC 10802]